MAEAVYIMCALASLTCTALLLRAYGRNRVRLLLWSGICFAGLSANNLLLIADKMVFPDVNLSPWRSAAALLGLATLLFGLVWDSDGKGGRTP